ncbi:MAG TPA: WD40 repeat domain-containing protein [Caulobacterales bacterium]|nr:WD40 repeat domain-containing protein [Caulobacterales bacterium]
MRGVTALVYSKGQRLALGAPATSVHWLGGDAVFTLGDGAAFNATTRARHALHDGAILSAAAHPDGKRLVTGGDDGKVLICAAGGACETLADLRGKWVDHLVSGFASNTIVVGAGKQAIVFKAGVESHRFMAPSTIGGLALDAKGRRLAVSHYGGVTLRYALMADDKGVQLNWAGSHLAVTLSPEADYVVSAMQENELHGWRMPEKLDLRMSGYAAKTRSFSWDKRGRWLATSGADCAVVWPFVGKLGPQGKEPLLLARREPLVTAVAFHPHEELLAIGYADGAVTLARFSDQAVIEMDEPGEGAVAALAWSSDGARVAFGDEAGRGGVINFAD